MSALATPPSPAPSVMPGTVRSASSTENDAVFSSVSSEMTLTMRGVLAIGAVFFMLSDSLLAINRFAMPFAGAQFWVLTTYYVAQLLIAHNVRIGSGIVGWGNAPAMAAGAGALPQPTALSRSSAIEPGA